MLFAAVCLLLASCSATFTDASKLPCKIGHRIEGEKLIVTATVTNQSKSVLTFVRHPSHYSISVYAADRTKDKSIGPGAGMIVDFLPATPDNLVHVPPGNDAVFELRCTLHRKSRSVLEVDELPATMRIWDSHVRTTFSYGWYPDHLTRSARTLGGKFVATELKAEEVFPRP